mgnify:CR=1 FL=1
MANLQPCCVTIVRGTAPALTDGHPPAGSYGPWSSARPKPLNVTMVAIGAATYISFALYTLYDVFLS